MIRAVVLTRAARDRPDPRDQRAVDGQRVAVLDADVVGLLFALAQEIQQDRSTLRDVMRRLRVAAGGRAIAEVEQARIQGKVASDD